MVTLPAATLARYERFSLYNSPYPAHDAGCAVDLYPAGEAGVSPVAGTVRDVRTVRAPAKPYAAAADHLILVDVDADCLAAGADLVARVLHVDPAVEPGDRVAVGDSLGEMVRSGYFAPWVDDHVHLGFRRADQNAVRAGGSLRVDVDVEIDAREWDGRGTVVATGETWVRLDTPWDDAVSSWTGVAGAPGVALDGGLPHYEGGGALPSHDGPVSVAGSRVGVAAGRDVAWDDVTLTADGRPITGLSCFLARTPGYGVKLVCPDHEFAVGDRVAVSVRR